MGGDEEGWGGMEGEKEGQNRTGKEEQREGEEERKGKR